MIDQTAEDAAAFGIEIDLPKQPDFFEVDPDAWPAVQLFLRCQTQWRSGPAGLIGLDYLAVELTSRLYGATDLAAMLEDIQVIEGEILLAVHEKAK